MVKILAHGAGRIAHGVLHYYNITLKMIKKILLKRMAQDAGRIVHSVLYAQALPANAKAYTWHAGLFRYAPCAMRYALLLILLAGTSLRIFQYFQNQSLYLDEANLARNYIEKSFIQLFTNLDYKQYAPPFFSFIEKICLEIGGNTEYALRLFPLLCGIASLFLFYLLCKKFISSKHILYPLILISFSVVFLNYSIAVKQYATDTSVALFLVLTALYVAPQYFNFRKGFIWSILGAFVIWLSMPAIFILAGIFFYYASYFILKKRWKSLQYLIYPFLLWLCSFSFYYFLILRNDISSDHLQNYHAPYMLPFPPTSFDELSLGGSIILNIFVTAIGHTVLAYVWGISCCIIGFIQIWKDDSSKALLIISPIILCLAASCLNYYSLTGRLILFFVPLILLLIGKGVEVLFSKAPLNPPKGGTSLNYSFLLRIVFIIIMIITAYNYGGFSYFYKPYEVEEIKQVLNYIVKHKQQNELLYVHHGAVPAFIFYTEKYKFKNKYVFRKTILGKWSDNLNLLKEKIMANSPLPRLHQDRQGDLGGLIWIIFTNITDEQKKKKLDEIESIGEQKIKFEAYGAGCYLYELIEKH